MKPRALVLLSSGLDSSANLALASNAGFTPELAITFDYGQKAAAQETLASAKIAKFFSVPHEVVSLPFWKNTGLVSDVVSPKLSASDLRNASVTKASMRSVWVPGRNGVFAAVGAAIAEARGLSHVLMGLNREEGETFPDNTRAFMEAQNEAFRFTTLSKVELGSLTVDLSKVEIVAKLRELQNFPFDFLWSCYEGGEKPCRSCESCQRLVRALEGVYNESPD